jgi:hypothetical protein
MSLLNRSIRDVCVSLRARSLQCPLSFTPTLPGDPRRDLYRPVPSERVLHVTAASRQTPTASAFTSCAVGAGAVSLRAHTPPHTFPGGSWTLQHRPR